MDVSGLCDICGRRSDGFSCTLCGKRTCRDCMTLSGICKACAGRFNIDQDRRFVDKFLKSQKIDGNR